MAFDFPFLTAEELDAVRLSLSVASLATLLSLPFAIGIAWVLSRCNFWGKSLLNGIVPMPLVLPPVVIGYLLPVTLGTQGPLGGLLDRWLGPKLIFTMRGAVVAVAFFMDV